MTYMRGTMLPTRERGRQSALRFAVTACPPNGETRTDGLCGLNAKAMSIWRLGLEPQGSRQVFTHPGARI